MQLPAFHVRQFPALAFLVGFGLVAQTPPPPIDNDQVRVVKVTDKPHAKGSPHEHKLNRVMIYLQAGRQDVTPQGGKTVAVEWKAGEVKWSPATGMHTSEITSDMPVTIVELEVKKAGDPSKTVNAALDPLKADPKDYKLEFENSQVRVIRVKMAAGRNVPLHEHVLNRVVVTLTDQNGAMTTPDGQTTTAVHNAGDFSWGGPTKHVEKNNMDHTFEAVIVEFKS
jgi:quercetin dioxygenase-like cupin family protein